MQTSYILACINSVKPDMWNYNSPKQVVLEMEDYWKFAWVSYLIHFWLLNMNMEKKQLDFIQRLKLSNNVTMEHKTSLSQFFKIDIYT